MSPSCVCSVQPGDVVSFRATSDHLQPAYCLAVSEQHRQILLAVRGTKNFNDALTNLAGNGNKPASFLEGTQDDQQP